MLAYHTWVTLVVFVEFCFGWVAIYVEEGISEFLDGFVIWSIHWASNLIEQCIQVTHTRADNRKSIELVGNAAMETVRHNIIPKLDVQLTFVYLRFRT